MLEMKNNVTEIKNAFGELINRLDTAKERMKAWKDYQCKLPKLKC